MGKRRAQHRSRGYAEVLAGTHTPLIQRDLAPGPTQSMSATHPFATGQQTPFPQQAKSGAQVARKGVQVPLSHRTPAHGSSPCATQSVSVKQFADPSVGQHAPLPQQA